MSNESNETTAVAAAEEKKLNVGAREAVDLLGEEGKALVLAHKERTQVARIIEGCEWGNVRGSALSPATRNALADFCISVGAIPSIHINILGGKPDLNAQYWADRMNADPSFVRFEQTNVTPGQAEELRAQAEVAIADVQKLEGMGMNDEADNVRQEAAQLLAMSRLVTLALMKFGVPSGVLAAYVTDVFRYRNGAPLEKIRRGEVDGAEWIEKISECNWAGSGRGTRKDPIGDGDPHLTARTRSIRRASRVSFPTIQAAEKAIARAEELLEAEWQEIKQEERATQAALPRPGEVQAVASNGEPTARTATGAHDLPTHGAQHPTEPAPAANAPADAVDDDEQPWDPEDARKRFFATFRDAGIKEDRKAWQAANNLPESTKDWGKDEYHRANTILVTPTIEAVAEAAQIVGIDDLARFASEKLGHDPDTLKDWQQVLSHLNARADAPEQTAAL